MDDVQTLCDRVLDTEEQIAKQLAERRHLRQQLEQCRGRLAVVSGAFMFM